MFLSEARLSIPMVSTVDPRRVITLYAERAHATAAVCDMHDLLS